MAAAAVLGITIIALLYCFTGTIITFFDFETARSADAVFVVKGIGLATAFTIATGVYGAVLNGIQRLDLINICYSAFMTVEVCLASWLLYSGYGIRVLVLTYGGSIVLTKTARFAASSSLRNHTLDVNLIIMVVHKGV